MKQIILFLASCLTAFILPTKPVSAQIGTRCFASPTKPDVVYATSSWTYNATDQTITIRTYLSKTFVDNTYGTGAVGWSGGHKFGDLTGSDELQLALYDVNNTKKLEFKMDYLTASSAAPSGYKSLGVTGGEGKMLTGNASDVVSVTTSLDQNFNTYGYVLTTNSPSTDNNYTKNTQYPNWIYDVWYEVTVKASAFGGLNSFGFPDISGVHASPSKTGNNSEVVEPKNCLIPPPTPPGPGGQQCWESPTKPDIVWAKTKWTYNGDGTVTIRTTFAKTFVDNTYGTNAIGWPNGHTFNNLVGSDNLELSLYDKLGNEKMDFKIDYVTASSAAPSGYQTLGVTGGEGKMILGSASDVVSAMTSIDKNLNAYGYVLTTNSPQTDTGYKPNPQYPNWIYEVWYEVTVKESAFANGFGYPMIESVHASPSKTGNNTEIVIPKDCPCEVQLSGVVTNATCNGSNTGSIDVSVTGNSGTVSYLWSDGATTEDRTNLKAGTYTVTVTDAGVANCTATKSFTISEPTATSITSVVGNVTNKGGNDGSINITVSGGTPPYTYLWNDGVTTEDRTNLKAGTYTVTVTDARGCPATKSFLVDEPKCDLLINGTKTDVDCFNGSNGTITIFSVINNVAYVSFLWNDGVTTMNRTGLTAGTYTLTVTDPATGCQASKSFTLSAPSTPVGITGIVGNVTAPGANNGSINITVTGGVPPYTYLWSDGATTEDRTGLAAGTYSVTVTDSRGCPATKTFVINQPSCSLAISGTKQDVTCYGTATGAINITSVTGNVGTVTYSWNDGPTTQNRTNLTKGTYTVLATDQTSKCTASQTFAITEPPAIGLTAVVGNVTSSGGSNGYIDITVTGGTPPYTYLWNDGVTTEDRTGLHVGTYSVSVLDSRGCPANKSFTISQPSCNLSITANKTDVNCFGTATGSITITTITGNTGPVNFLWSDGATTQNRTGLGKGTYSVVVTDPATQCTTTQSFTITEPTKVAVTAVIGNVTTVGGSNGYIDITVTGGTPPYTYKWNDGPTTEDRTGLPAGTYTVVVTDSRGCPATATFTVNGNNCNLLINGTKQDVSCGGMNDGSITIFSVINNVSYVTFLWNDGVTSMDRTGLAAGTYTLTVTDPATGCKAARTFVIGASGTPININPVITNVTTPGGNNGSITLTVTGGTPPYTYLWNDGATTKDRTGLTAGTYSVTVKDSRGCPATGTFTVTGTTCNLVINGSKQDVNCNGGSTGSITITSVTGNVGAVTFLWNDGATTQNRTGLVKGNYSVTATDASTGCKSVLNFTIVEPPAISVTGVVGNVTSGNNGSINVTVTGGVPPYTYLWNDGVTTEDRTGLAAGTYTVTVTDSRGCPATATFTVGGSSCNLIINGTKNNISCYGAHDGSITIFSVINNVAYVSFLWNDGVTTMDRTGLAAGTYTLTVTDPATGCKASKSFVITEPLPLMFSAIVTDVSTLGGHDGAIDVTVSGGTPPYSYYWNDGVTTEDRSGLVDGSYIVTITDAHGCSVAICVIIRTKVQCSLNVTGVVVNTCGCGTNDGSITLTVTGGTAPYTYKWNDGATVKDRINLGKGAYTVTVTDSKGCATTVGFSVDNTIVYNKTVSDNTPVDATAGQPISKIEMATASNFNAAVYPNPTTGRVKLSITSPSNGFVMANVVDMNGRRIMSMKLNVVKGNNVKDLNIVAPSSGIYNVELIAEHNRKVLKVIVQK